MTVKPQVTKSLVVGVCAAAAAASVVVWFVRRMSEPEPEQDRKRVRLSASPNGAIEIASDQALKPPPSSPLAAPVVQAPPDAASETTPPTTTTAAPPASAEPAHGCCLPLRIARRIPRRERAALVFVLRFLEAEGLGGDVVPALVNGG